MHKYVGAYHTSILDRKNHSTFLNDAFSNPILLMHRLNKKIISIVIVEIILTFSLINESYSFAKDESTRIYLSEHMNVALNISKEQNKLPIIYFSQNSIISHIINTTTNWIAIYGYPGVFAAALLENLFPPIPSELIFPAAGFAANTKNLGVISGILGMAAMGALGSTTGAIIIYYISMRIGKPAILKIGKYVGIGEKSVETAESWFEKHGSMAVFLGRMAPGIREIISIPAGIQKMNLSKFILFTFAGSLIWSVFLTSIGFYLGEAWNIFYEDYSFVFDVVAVLLIVGIIVGIIIRHYKNKNEKEKKV